MTELQHGAHHKEHASAQPTEPTAGAPDAAPLIGLVSVLLQRPRTMVGVPLGLAALAVLAATIRGPKYEAESLIQAQERQSSMVPGVAGLAAQFGINVGALGQGTDRLEFYPRLLRSEELLREAVLTEYSFSTRGLGALGGDTLRGNLLDLLELSGPTEAARIRKGVRALARSITTRVDPISGTFTLVVRQPWPQLAEKVNRRLLDLVNQFNLQKRQSQAAAEARFIEGRLAEARQEVNQAERELAAFLAANRLYQGDPQLVFEFDRLGRRVTLQNQLYGSLAQAYDQARIDAVRNTPVITVVAPPEATGRKATGRLLYAALGFAVGGLIAVGLAFFAEHLARQRLRHPEELARLAVLTRQARRRLLPAPIRRLSSR